jgi:methylase of polypeptide subunit release factors
MTRTDDRHRYGQHYTPPVVARLLAAFAIRTAPDIAFDPSCGDGRLLEAARSAKLALAAEGSPTSPAADETSISAEQNRATSNQIVELFGIDRSDKAVTEASRTGAKVAVADFFDIKPGDTVSDAFSLPSRVDSIIGNPPYIRQELLGDHKSRISKLLGSATRGRKRLERHPLSRKRGPGRSSGNGSGSAEQSAERVNQVYIPRWSGRSDIYVYFFAHAASFLRPGGRLVFLTASSWLDVAYGASLQEFMLANFSIVAVVESAVESFFEDASVNTSITVLERQPDPVARGRNPVRFIQSFKPLGDILPSGTLGTIRFARALESGEAPDGMRIRTVEQKKLQASLPASVPPGSAHRDVRASVKRSELARRTSWGRFLRADDVFFRVLDKAAGRLAPLADLASVRFGVKTGANDFFYLRPGPGDHRRQVDTAANPLKPLEMTPVETGPLEMRPLESLATVRRGMTTGANEFFYLKSPPESETSVFPRGLLRVQNRDGDAIEIESKYLHPVVFSLKEIPRIEIKDSRTRMLFFDCPDSPEQLKGTRAIKYIKAGERADLHLRPTCSARVPWYDVARGKKPAPLIFPSKIGERWLVAINHAGVHEDKKLYGVFPRRSVPVQLLAAMLNSTWARYYAEMTCRQLTGAQAIADIDVSVAEQILLPDPEALDGDERRQLVAALRAIAGREVLSIFNEVEMPDRRRLDELILSAIGFREESERRSILIDLYRAATGLVRSRLARSRGRI